jgi:folate-binding protein YgfZ
MMISLPELELLEIAGADAVNFAHAQFSSDVRSLENGAWQWSAWLSPQGRVRAFFSLIRTDDEHLLLLLRGGHAEVLRAALAPYVMREKVGLRAADDRYVLGSDADHASALRLPGMPQRWLILCENEAAADTSPPQHEAWRLADIRAGLPQLPDTLLDQLLPQWLGLDRLGAISVKKGCYPGQEVMSRLHFKGGNKRSLYRLQLHANTAPGATLATVNGESAGQIVTTAQRDDGDYEALAALNDGLAGTPLVNATVLEHFG